MLRYEGRVGLTRSNRLGYRVGAKNVPDRGSSECKDPEIGGSRHNLDLKSSLSQSKQWTVGQMKLEREAETMF